MVLEKINALKNQNRSIEDIYKYTNDIIFEEEGEQTDYRDSDVESIAAREALQQQNQNYDLEVQGIYSSSKQLDKSPSFY